MSEYPEPTRRVVLGAGGAGLLALGVLGLAACSAKSSSSKTGAAAPATTPTTAETPTSAASGGSAPANSASSAGGGGTVIASLASVPVGGSASAKLDGKPIILSQQNAGTITAFTAICTHMGCTVNPGGAQLNCPCHGSVYNAFTGAVIQGPAPTPLGSIPVKVVGTSIEAG
jgi:cytochrome b6-f complex iron-sulfur subunit